MSIGEALLLARRELLAASEELRCCRLAGHKDTSPEGQRCIARRHRCADRVTELQAMASPAFVYHR